MGRPGGKVRWADQLIRPGGKVRWADQVIRPGGKVKYIRQVGQALPEAGGQVRYNQL